MSDDVVYWVADDSQQRNARVLRPVGGRPGSMTPAASPVYSQPAAAPAAAQVYATPAAPVYATPPAPVYGAPPAPWQGYGYPQGGYGYGYPQGGWGRGWGMPPYGAPGPYGMPGSLGGFFGNLSLGTLIDAGTQIVAAFMALPTPPAPTTDGSTDTANLVTYQSALAAHTKRDEQIRTVGSLASKLLAS